MSQSLTTKNLDYSSDTYRDSFSRINGIVIEGEQEAYNNFMSLAELLPEFAEELIQLGKMERGHRKSFEACGKNLDVIPDLERARDFFADLRQLFQTAATHQKVPTCLLIQSLVIECFAIAAYHNYIPVADNFARKITQSVVKDEYSHLNFGSLWLKQHFAEVKTEIETANRQILPMILRMLNQVESDVKVLGMNKLEIVEEFMVHYGEALHQMGFKTTEILRLSSQALTA